MVKTVGTVNEIQTEAELSHFGRSIPNIPHTKHLNKVMIHVSAEDGSEYLGSQDDMVEMFPQEDEFDQNDDDLGVTEAVTTPILDGSNLVENKKRKLTQADLESDPAIQRMLDAMVEKKLQAALNKQNKGGTGKIDKVTDNMDNQTNNLAMQINTPVSNKRQNVPPLVKSPSDTTVYAPALKKTPVGLLKPF